MNMSLKKRIIIILSCVIFMLLSCCVLTGFAPVNQYYSSVNKFDRMDLSNELESIDGFAWNKYPFDSTGAIATPKIINVVEYCYSYRANQANNYGVYLYFYNPQNINYDTSGKQSTCMLAVDWEERDDGQVVPIEYEKFNLRFISKIEEGEHANKFYKFKIVDKVADYDKKTMYQRLDADVRRYDISEIELLKEGDSNSSHLKIATRYSYSGFAKGYGEDVNAESDLKWSVTDLEVLEIEGDDIGFSCYKLPYNNENGINHYNVVNSVYFSIPNEMLDEYGNLQKIKFEAYEYKTSPMIVTKDRELYDKIIAARNIDTVISSTKPDFNLNYAVNDAIGTLCLWTYNNDVSGVQKSTHLPYAFYKDYSDNTYDVTSKELISYINNYAASNFNGYLPHRNLTRDLFMGNVDEGRKEGYFCQEIDAGDLKTLTSYDLSNGWKNLWNFLSGKKPEAISNEFKPIYQVSKDYTTESLYIFEKDKSEFNEKMAIAKTKNRSMQMFHFAFTDYQSFPLFQYKGGAYWSAKAYAAQTTAFLDFDLIQVTLSKAGKMTVIPIAMSPIDIISGIWSPDTPNLPQWLKILIIILIVIVVLLLVSLILKVLGFAGGIVKVVFVVLTAPFKFIVWIFTGGKSKKKKKGNDIEVTKYDYNKRHKKE